MNISIRLCQNSDLEALRNLAYETYDDAFRSMNTPETMQAYLAEAFDLQKMKQELANPNNRFYFLHADGCLAGFTKLNTAPGQTDINDSSSLEIERIYVKTGFKRKGLGKVLIEHAQKIALNLGKQYVWLGVWEKNESGILFYQKMGFVEFSRHTFRMGDELQSDWVMKKELSQVIDS